jgi:3-oxoadipate enol-lactonase/4-carboxymuconolactone decarboxylase
MTVPGIRCSVVPVRSGAPDAQLIVLGPSLGTASEIWSGVADELSDDYRVLRFDLPGHGFSPPASAPFSVAELADAVVALVDSVGGGAFHYAGVSLGGAVGLQLALRHQNRLLSLTTLCSGATIGEPDGWRARAAQVRASGTASVVAGSARRWFAPGFLDRDPEGGGAALNKLLDVDDESYALCCEALAGHDVRERLGEIAVRTLCIAGDADEVAPPESSREVADSVQHGSLAVIADAAHLPMLERPAEVIALILAQVRNETAGTAAGVDTGAAPGASTDAAGAAASPDATAAYERGMAVRRAVLGDAHVDAANAKITAETAAFQDFITRYAWGEIWSRPGLDRRTRSFLTLAALVAGGHPHELGMHVRAALTNGLTREEITEALLHTAIYAGLPAANSAFAIAAQVFAELDAPPASDS